MGDDKGVDAIRAAVSALNAGDVEGYLANFEPSCLRRVPGVDDPRTLDEIRDDLGQLFGAFDPLHLDEDLLFGSDRFVCARWNLRGVHTGDYFGLAPTGREISVPTCEVYEFGGARVIATWAYGDPLDLFRQLGVLPDAEGAQ